MSFQLMALFNLTGRRALVTGGNSGIGAALALGLGLAGASIILVARRKSELDATASVLRKRGIEVHTIAADLIDNSAIECIKSEVDSASLTVDIVVNAAGMNLREPFNAVSADTFDAHTAIHLRAPFLLTQAFAPAMAQRRWGRIINIASLQSYRAFPNSAPYGASKGGVLQLTRAIAEEWSRCGINCNAIAPGFFPTALTAKIFEDPSRTHDLAQQTAIGRNGICDDLVGTVVYLASNASAYVTGQTIAVDGGFTAK